MPSLFADDAVIRRVAAENVLLAGGGRALLLQLAHPCVAAGVADHSDFEADPLRRLKGTLDAMNTIVFGTIDEAERTAAAIRTIHDRVTGPGYSANDPALLCWVNATLLDTALRVYTRLVRRLSSADADEYYEQSTKVAELLGCPLSEQPADLAAFQDYMRTMVATLEVTDTARALARAVLHPRLPRVARPPLAAARFITVGMLPAPIRRQYGFSWSDRRKAAFKYGTAAAARLVPLVPSPLRHVQLV